MTTQNAARSGSPARRAAAQAAARTAGEAVPGPGLRLDTSRVLLRLGVVGIASMATAYASMVALMTWPGPIAWLLPLLVPAAVTLWRIPQTRRTGLHRWPTIWLIGMVTSIGWFFPTLVVAQIWVLHRFWTVEFPPGTRRDTGESGGRSA